MHVSCRLSFNYLKFLTEIFEIIIQIIQATLKLFSSSVDDSHISCLWSHHSLSHLMIVHIFGTVFKKGRNKQSNSNLSWVWGQGHVCGLMLSDLTRTALSEILSIAEQNRHTWNQKKSLFLAEVNLFCFVFTNLSMNEF